MAASFDELIAFLLDEIALRGEQGALIQEILTAIDRFYVKDIFDRSASAVTSPTIAAERGPVNEIGSQSTASPVRERAFDQQPYLRPPHCTVDRHFKTKVWEWLVAHREVWVGKKRQGNRLSLERAYPEYFQARPSEDLPDGVDKFVNSCSLDLPGDGEESSLQSQPNVSRNNQWRVYTSQHQYWLAITGHGVDWARIQKLEFDCLSMIAQYRESGILQSELVRLTGQDKRSVPRRTDTLYEKGYIMKKAWLVRGCKTSKLILKRYATGNDQSSTISAINQHKRTADEGEASLNPLPKAWTADGVDVSLIIQNIFELLRKYKLITFMDLKRTLGLPETTWHRKFFSRTIRKLELLGCVRRVIATSEQIKSRKWKCMKLLREPEDHEWRLLRSLDTYIPARSQGGLPTTIAGGEVDEEEEEQDDFGLGQVLEAPLTLAGMVQEGNSQLQEVSRHVPQWTPWGGIVHPVQKIVKSSQESGISTMDIRDKVVGRFYTRPLEGMLERLTEDWKTSQPSHIHHLTIIRDISQIRRAAHYRYFTLSSFERLVNSGASSWEALGVKSGSSKDERVPKSGLPNPVTVPGAMYHFGIIPQSSFFKAHGKPTLLDIMRGTKVEQLFTISSDPNLALKSDGTIGLEWGSHGRKGGHRIQPTISQDGGKDGTLRALEPSRGRGRPKKSVNNITSHKTRDVIDAQTLIKVNGKKRKLSECDKAERASKKRNTNVETTNAAAPADVDMINTNEVREPFPVPCRTSGRRRKRRVLPDEESLVNDIEMPSSDPHIAFQGRPPSFCVIVNPPDYSKPKVKGGRRGRPKKALIVVIQSEALKRTSAKRPKSLTTPKANVLGKRKLEDLTRNKTQRSPRFTQDIPKEGPLLSLDIQDPTLSPKRRKTTEPITTATRASQPLTSTYSILVNPERSPLNHSLLGDLRSENTADASLPNMRKDSVHQRKLLHFDSSNHHQAQLLPEPRLSRSEQEADDSLTVVAQDQSVPSDTMHSQGIIGGIEDGADNLEDGSMAVDEVRTSAVSLSETPMELTSDSGSTPQPKMKRSTKLIPPRIAHTALRGGTVSFQRKKVVLDLMRKHGGAFPGDREMFLAWKDETLKQYPDVGTPDYRTYKAVEKSLVDTAQIKRLKFSFTTRAGIPLTRTILTFSELGPSDPPVRSMEAKIIQADGAETAVIGVEKVKGAPKSVIDQELDQRVTLHIDSVPGRRAVAIEEAIIREEQRRVKRSRKLKEQEYRKQLKAEKRAQRQDILASSKRKFHEYVLTEGEKERITKSIQEVSEQHELQNSSTSQGSNRVAQLHGLLNSRSVPSEISLGDLNTMFPRSGALSVSSLLNQRSELRHGLGPKHNKHKAQPLVDSLFAPLLTLHKTSGTFGTYFRNNVNMAQARYKLARGKIIWKRNAQSLLSIMYEPLVLLHTVSGTFGTHPQRVDSAERIKLKLRRTASVSKSEHQTLSESMVRPAIVFQVTSGTFGTYFQNGLEIVNKYRAAQRPQYILTSSKPGSTIYREQRPLVPLAPKLTLSPRSDMQASAGTFDFLTTSANIGNGAGSLSRAMTRPYLASSSTPRGPGRPPSLFPKRILASQIFKTRKLTSREHAIVVEPSKASKEPKQKSSTILYSNGKPVAHKLLQRRTRGALSFPDLPEEAIEDVIIAVVVIRTVIGGLDKNIDWVIISRLFPNYGINVIETRWARIAQKYKTRLEMLYDDFQDIFLEAYQSNVIPPLDFDNLLAYDWRWLVNWAREHLEAGNRSDVVVLPDSRHKFDSLFNLEKQKDRCKDWKDDCHDSSVAHLRRMRVSSKVSFAKPLNAEKIIESNESELLIARSWIRANVITETEKYNSSAAKQKLFALKESILDTALHQLLKDNVIVHSNRGRDIPGRNYDITERVLKSFNREFTTSLMSRTAAFKNKLDVDFSNRGFSTYSYYAEDPETLAVINLVTSGRIALDAVNAPIRPMGLTKDYRSRGMDKGLLHFGMELRPTSFWVYGNPLPHLAPPPGKHLGEKLQPIPIWYDIHGNLISGIWGQVLTAILYTVSMRSGVLSEELARIFKPSLDLWEIELCLAWCKETGVVQHSGVGGWNTTGWWWCLGWDEQWLQGGALSSRKRV